MNCEAWNIFALLSGFGVLFLCVAVAGRIRWAHLESKTEDTSDSFLRWPCWRRPRRHK